MAGLRGTVGGEVFECTKLLVEESEQVLDRMVDEARNLGAHAIIDARFEASMVMQGSAQFLAYGTAIVLRDE